jgi:phage terminase large subunit
MIRHKKEFLPIELLCSEYNTYICSTRRIGDSLILGYKKEFEHMQIINYHLGKIHLCISTIREQLYYFQQCNPSNFDVVNNYLNILNKQTKAITIQFRTLFNLLEDADNKNCF